MYFSSLETGKKNMFVTYKHFSISHTFVLHSSDWKTVPVWRMEIPTDSVVNRLADLIQSKLTDLSTILLADSLGPLHRQCKKA